MIRYEPNKFECLYEVMKNSIAKAKLYDEEVEFTFNGTTISVYPHSDIRDIDRIYTYKRKLQQLESQYRR